MSREIQYARNNTDLSYCRSLTRILRRRTREVMVGDVGVGGDNPLRIQSMTTSDTMDVAATVAEIAALAEAGCEIVRVTAPNVTVARRIRDIRLELDRMRIKVPLVADIHFLPAAAMEAAEHVEKVRINPGNFADRKKFAVREYTDDQYEEELQRLYEAFSPLVKRCLTLGRSMRIGVNHGSLSDRVMNRYGDTPLGMVEAALEFLRIAESHGYRDIILSMKSSNPKVMIQAYRLLVARMDKENMPCPLHLGVTEAGDGEDGRIKSAIGIGSLLADGLGDTIRVSLTEDSVHEIPVARALAERIQTQWRVPVSSCTLSADPLFTKSPFEFNRREIIRVPLAGGTLIASDEPPRVFVRIADDAWKDPGFQDRFKTAARQTKDTPIEGIILSISGRSELDAALEKIAQPAFPIRAAVLDLADGFPLSYLQEALFPDADHPWILLSRFSAEDRDVLEDFLSLSAHSGAIAAVDIDPADLTALSEPLKKAACSQQENRPCMIFCLSRPSVGAHAIGSHRLLVHFLEENGISAPVWIRNTAANALQHQGNNNLSNLLEASILSGSLLCDGIGDIVSLETGNDFIQAAKLTYNVLQGAGARISKTEFVACPSCGRTLFDLQTTTRLIREKTGHLKGVKIAIMGCIVNGPGEMADADFGYVGGAPGKVNLYVGKKCVRFHVPEREACDRLIELIREHGKWTEPEPAETVGPQN